MRGKWGALGAGALLLWGWAGVASAKTHPRVIVKASANLIKPGGKVTLQALAQGLKGPLNFVFREKSATGPWKTIRPMKNKSTMRITLSRPGTYWIEAGVVTNKKRRLATFSGPQAIYVGAVPTLKLSQSSVSTGTPQSFTVSAPPVFHPLYQFQYRTSNGPWVAIGPFSKAASTQLSTATPGPYQARAAVKTAGGATIYTAPGVWSVYGQPAAITLTPSQKSLVADGEETEILTASVVDSQGDVVANYNGTGSLTDATPNGAISQWGTSQNLAALDPQSSLPLTFVDGMATVELQAGSTVSGDTLTASTADNLQGSATIAAVPQIASKIQLSTQSPDMIANESGNPANYTASVLDQAGYPMLAGSYNLSMTITGPGQFHDLTPGPDALVYTGGQPATPITVYSIAGSLGPVTLTVSGGNLPQSSVTIPAILGGQPAQMGVSAPLTTLQDGQSTTLTLTQLTKTGGVCDPASLDNSGYVVAITDAQGNPASGFSLGGAMYTGQSMSFAVATGPNYFYATSQSVTLTATTATPGQYDIVVADSDGLWKPSNPLVITVQGQ